MYVLMGPKNLHNGDLPDNIKKFLDETHAPSDVRNEIINAFRMLNSSNYEQLHNNMSELQKKINEDLIYTWVTTFLKHVIVPSQKDWKIEYEKSKWWIGATTLKIWENSMVVKFNTGFAPEDGHHIRSCSFDFSPENMPIETKIQLLKDFQKLVRKLYWW